MLKQSDNEEQKGGNKKKRTIGNWEFYNGHDHYSFSNNTIL